MNSTNIMHSPGESRLHASMRDSLLDIGELNRLSPNHSSAKPSVSRSERPTSQSLQNHLEALRNLESKFSPFSSVENPDLDSSLYSRKSHYNNADLLDSLDIIEKQLATMKSYKSSIDQPRRARSPRVYLVTSFH
jgi:hypothetical protein